MLLMLMLWSWEIIFFFLLKFRLVSAKEEYRIITTIKHNCQRQATLASFYLLQKALLI